MTQLATGQLVRVIGGIHDGEIGTLYGHNPNTNTWNVTFASGATIPILASRLRRFETASAPVQEGLGLE